VAERLADELTVAEDELAQALVPERGVGLYPATWLRLPGEAPPERWRVALTSDGAAEVLHADIFIGTPALDTTVTLTGRRWLPPHSGA
jgi:hypothetical protein